MQIEKLPSRTHSVFEQSFMTKLDRFIPVDPVAQKWKRISSLKIIKSNWSRCCLLTFQFSNCLPVSHAKTKSALKTRGMRLITEQRNAWHPRTWLQISHHILRPDYRYVLSWYHHVVKLSVPQICKSCCDFIKLVTNFQHWGVLLLFRQEQKKDGFFSDFKRNLSFSCLVSCY